MSSTEASGSEIVPETHSHALRYWSIGLDVAAILAVFWALTRSEILGPLDLPRWVHDVAGLVTPVTVAAAFLVNVANFATRHRKPADIIALVVATLVFAVVALFIVGEVVSPH